MRFDNVGAFYVRCAGSPWVRVCLGVWMRARENVRSGGVGDLELLTVDAGGDWYHEAWSGRRLVGGEGGGVRDFDFAVPDYAALVASWDESPMC
jgi:hypothetical protein